MLRFLFIATLICAHGSVGAAQAPGALAPVQLRCEYLVDPVGIDAVQPRLSWVLESGERGQLQTAYEIRVASSLALLGQGVGDLWDTGEVPSAEQNQIEYQGAPLKSHQECFWSVRVWDRHAVPGVWSAPARWTMGILSPEDWQAAWITAPEGVAQDTDQSGPLPLFRRDFQVNKPVRRALLYACGLGFQEVRLNGTRVGDSVFDPGWTNYRKTCLYTSTDVTALLRDKDNTLGLLLGNGFFNVPGGRYVKFTGSFGPPQAILQLRIEYADGATEDVVTGDAWRAARGPITFSCIYGGEDYDAREEQPGWDMPGFDDKTWAPALEIEGPGGRLSSRSAPPIKVMDVHQPVEITKFESSTYVYDLGQNASGRPRIRVTGNRGDTVKIIPGELLDENGRVSQHSSGGPMWFSYTLKGDGVEAWQPQFSFYGFRYLQVEGARPATESREDDHLPELLEVAGEFTYSSAEGAGHFESANPLVNQVHALILASMRSNLHSVLTDCPHREKLGWLEVSHLLSDGLMYNFNLARFYAKVSQDIADAQLENGLVPDIAPEYTVFQGGFRDSPEWGSASVLNPWNTWLMYGDRRILETHYDVMRRYVAYLDTTATDHIISHGLGDWYDVGPGGPGESKLTSKGVTATAVYYQNFIALREIATLLDKPQEADQFNTRAAQVRVAFNATYHHPEAGYYDRNSQTANAIPLILGLVEEEHREALSGALVESIGAANYHVTAGDVGFSYLVRALTETGQGDLLYKMVTQTDGPGYAYQLAQGATTLTEAWDANPHSSQIHCMLGHIDGWFYRGLAGIRVDPAAPGFRHVILRPQFPEGLAWVKGHYDSLRGRIASEWHVAGQMITWKVTIPTNTIAIVYIPTESISVATEGGKPLHEAAGLSKVREEEGGVVLEAGSGAYAFQWTR